MPDPEPSSGGRRLAEVAWVFLRLGATAFGGPAAHVALLEEELVHRRRWLTREEFLDLLGAANLIPGPNSTELAIHVGRKQAGWAGLVAAGLGFILPATVMVGGLAWAYVRFGGLPQVEGVMRGMKPVLIAIIAQALVSLGRSAVKTKGQALLGAVALAACAAGANELLVLFGAGTIAMVARGLSPERGRASMLGFLPAATAAPAAAAGFGLWPLFLFFLKVGSVLFGSGYVLIAFLRADLVDRWHWLTEAQLLDAVAAGQVTPGPLFTTATFIGYVLGGFPGAAVATVGIFLPAFVFVAVSGPLVPKLRRSKATGAFLDGVNVASLALMALVSWQLGRAALNGGLSVALALAAGLVLWRFRLNSLWLLLGGAVAGWVASWVSG